MANFLNYIAEKIIADKHSKLEEIIVILPSNRASLLLRNKILEKIKNPVISPEIISISEFIDELSGLHRINNVSAVFELYDIYCNNIPKKDQQIFDEFLGWAPTLINDFNLIDSNLVDYNTLFSTMIYAERIKNFGEEEINTSGIKNHNKFWKQIPGLYASLINKLLDKKIGTIGMQFRSSINQLESYIVENKKYHYFVGFNMLNEAEKTIIQEFISQEKGIAFWDIDKEFYEDKNHSAGNFIRSYFREWKCLKNSKPIPLLSEFKKEKKFQFIETSNKITQAKYVGKIINKYKKINSLNNMGIVIADQTIMNPILSGISSNINSWNLTMGLSISSSLPINFIDLIFEMHIKSRKIGFFHYHVLSLLEHNIIKTKLYKDKSKILDFVNNLKKSNIRFFSKKELSENSNSFEILLFEELSCPKRFLDNLQTILNVLIEDYKELKNDYNKSVLVHFSIINKVFSRLLNYGAQIKKMSLKLLYSIYREAIKEEKLNIKGDPSSEIQIMSLPETRLLNFDLVVITNVNEGILPKGKSTDSLLPFDVKKHYGIPTYFDQDFKEAYQFYRLIQSAKSIYLLYSSESSGINNHEKSRFIYQLEHLKKPKHSNNFIKVKNSFNSRRTSLKINKTKDVMDSLIYIAKVGFSPSALSLFIRSPLDFYFQKVLGVKEHLELFPEIKLKDIGNIMHKTLECLYSRYLGKKLKISYYESMIRLVPSVLNANFIKVYGGNTNRKGHNFLIFEELKIQCINLLNTEKDLIKKGNVIKILALEQKIHYDIKIKGLSFPIKLIGTIDRIDIWNDKLRILDYKTGSVNPSKLKFSTEFSFEGLNFKNVKEYSTLFQLMLYSYVYFNQNSCKGILAGVISTKTPKSYFHPIVTNSQENDSKNMLEKNNITHFENELKQVIKRIFEEKVPFTNHDLE